MVAGDMAQDGECVAHSLLAEDNEKRKRKQQQPAQSSPEAQTYADRKLVPAVAVAVLVLRWRRRKTGLPDDIVAGTESWA